MQPLCILTGTVVHGRGVGRRFGLPTANLQPDRGQTLPPTGVYATRTVMNGQVYTGVTNVGTRPTVDQEQDVTVETHLLDFSGDIYGQRLTVSFYQRLRGLYRFESTQALRAQIACDEERARALFAEAL